MMKEIKEGLQTEGRHLVQPDESAKMVGSGLLDVYSTPSMISFIEKTCMNMISPFMDEDHGTVGISVNIKHVKATAIDERVVCKAKITEREDKKITFSVEVFDDKGLIGVGTHKRYIINNTDFIKNLNKK